jgi:hypothetical protein
MNWYIGQPVIALNTHPKGRYVKDQVLKVHGIRMPFCSCSGVLLDVGIRLQPQYRSYRIICRHCNYVGPASSENIGWYLSHNFAPFDINISEAPEILKQSSINEHKN